VGARGRSERGHLSNLVGYLPRGGGHKRPRSGILCRGMGKETRRPEKTQAQDMLTELRKRDPASDLAESFRKASKALESASRDLVALRRRVTKPKA
jgi:hypothetical protein